MDFCGCCRKAVSSSSSPLCAGWCNHHCQGSPWLEFAFLWHGNDRAIGCTLPIPELHRASRQCNEAIKSGPAKKSRKSRWQYEEKGLHRRWEMGAVLPFLLQSEPLFKLQANILHQLRKAKTSDKASILALRTFPIITTTCSLFLLFPKAVRLLPGTLLCSAKELCA